LIATTLPELGEKESFREMLAFIAYFKASDAEKSSQQTACSAPNSR
jgi:hypothetical protein